MNYFEFACEFTAESAKIYYFEIIPKDLVILVAFYINDLLDENNISTEKHTESMNSLEAYTKALSEMNTSLERLVSPNGEFWIILLQKKLEIPDDTKWYFELENIPRGPTIKKTYLRILKDYNGAPPSYKLCLAAKVGSLYLARHAIRFIIDQKAKIIDDALIIAARHNQEQIISFLLSQGAKSFRMSIIYAIFNRHIDIANLILDYNHNLLISEYKTSDKIVEELHVYYEFLNSSDENKKILRDNNSFIKQYYDDYINTFYRLHDTYKLSSGGPI